MFLQFIGFEVGLVLAFYEYIFVNLHIANTDTIPLWTYAAQFFLCNSAYGLDRYQDVLQNESSNDELIDYINNNTVSVKSTIIISTIISCVCLLQDQLTIPLIPFFLLSVYYYRDFKKAFPLLKPVFIAFLLTFSSVVFPSIITEHNYSICQDFNALIPPICNMYSASNKLDIKDTAIDKLNNINTLPVVYGEKIANYCSLLSALTCTGFHVGHPNIDDNTVQFVVFQAQNLLSVLPNKNDFRTKMNYNYNRKFNLKIPIGFKSQMVQIKI
jgi:4-hydroxybenzoate polyprenyltransferase